MRSALRTTLLFLAASSSTALALPPGVGPLAWSDEFNGTALDTSKWAYYPWSTRDDAAPTSQAVSVSGGLLHMGVYTDEAGVNHTGFIETAKRSATSGAFTQFLYAPTFGYFETRIAFHSPPGQWSAFWVQSPTMGTPLGDARTAGTEIDVVEHRATDSAGNSVLSRYNAGIHWDGYGADLKSSTKLLGPMSGLTNDAWHTYGLLWTPTSYTLYYDGTPAWTLPATVPVSQRSQFLILSSEIRDGSWAGTIPAGGYGSKATSSNGMLINYVRVYSLPEPSAVLLACALAIPLARRLN